MNINTLVAVVSQYRIIVYYCAYSDVQSIGGVVQDRLPILLRHRSSVMYDLQHPRIVIECGHEVAIVVVLHHGELV